MNDIQTLISKMLAVDRCLLVVIITIRNFKVELHSVIQVCIIQCLILSSYR